jgi:hypothetical protein
MYNDTVQLNLAPISDALKILGLFSNSIESKERIGYWVKADILNKVIRNPTTFNLYIGLLYQNCKNTKVGNKSLADRLDSLYVSGNNQAQVKQNLGVLLKKFIDKAAILVRLSSTIRSKQLEQKRFKDKVMTDAEKETLSNNYYQFTQGICALILYATEFNKLINESNTKIDSTIEQYLGIITELNSVAMNIQRKQYATALVHVLFCLEKLDTSKMYNCRFKQLFKFGSFIATAVKAQNAEEVSAAIEAFALPPGSAAQKKYAKFSITLNAYVGLSAGEEYLEGLGAKPFYAVTTPIGFNFAFGANKFGSFSLFASLIDIGALTAYRFEDSNTDELPDLKFENVLAPGAYFVYGVPKYPISIGLGAQLGPNLRSVTNGSLGLNSTKGWRWGAFIAVDIPIISVLNSNNKYRKCSPCKKKKVKKVKKEKTPLNLNKKG